MNVQQEHPSVQEGVWVCWGNSLCGKSSSCEKLGSFCFQSPQNCQETALDQLCWEIKMITKEIRNKLKYTQQMSFYKMPMNVAQVQSHSPFISRSSFDLFLVYRGTLAHLDCVTEVLGEMRKHIKIRIQPAPIFESFKLECATSGSLARFRVLYLLPKVNLNCPFINA